MALDIEEIKKFYSKVHDVKIEFLAKHEANQLSEEVIEILRMEILKRNLDSDLLKMIDLQKIELTEIEFGKLMRVIKGLPCPKCGNRHADLQGVLIRTVVSFIVLTSYKKMPFIGCVMCSEKKVNNGLIITSLFGWWGFPWGLGRTPVAIFQILRGKRKVATVSDEILSSFINGNIATLMLNIKNEEELVKLIKHCNAYPEVN